MSDSRKTNPSVSPNPLLLAILIAIGVLVACGLTFILLDLRRVPLETPVSIAAARKATLPIYLTATLFPGAPAFPDAPTGPATLLPTVDFKLVGTPPPPDETADFIEEATENAKDPLPVVTELPISTPPVPVPPSGTYLTFTDPNLKVSFEYPANWFVEPTGGVGEDITLQNVDPNKIGMTKGIVVVTPDHFNIELEYLPDVLGKYSSFEEWVDSIEQGIPKENRTSRMSLKDVDGNATIEIAYTDPVGSDISIREIFIEKGRGVYHLRVIPANTKYTEILAHILKSMHLP